MNVHSRTKGTSTFCGASRYVRRLHPLLCKRQSARGYNVVSRLVVFSMSYRKGHTLPSSTVLKAQDGFCAIDFAIESDCIAAGKIVQTPQ
jgi:hypothetical protein